MATTTATPIVSCSSSRTGKSPRAANTWIRISSKPHSANPAGPKNPPRIAECHRAHKALPVVGGGGEIACDEEQRRHEERLQEALIDAEEQFRAETCGLAVDIVPVSE